MRLLSSSDLLLPGALLLVILVLGGCSYFIDDLAQLAPQPEGVTVKKPPEIISADAKFTLTNKQDYGYYRRIWRCYWWGCTWVYYWVWTHTDVTGNISINVDINDPSRDLDNNPSLVRIMNSEPAPGTPGTNVCLLDIDQQDISLSKSNIAGTGKVKIVKIQLKNVFMKFTPQCMTYSAEIPVWIVVDDHGVEVWSPTAGRAPVVVKKP